MTQKASHTLIERDRHLSELQSAARTVAQGAGCVALVWGEAGVGKTSLVKQFTADMVDTHRVLWGSCDALFTPRPLGPLQDVAADLSGALLRMLYGGAEPAAIFEALREELATHTRPTVLVFEDMHWADHATLDLIKFLSRRTASLRTLLVLTYREDELSRDHPFRQVLGDMATQQVLRMELAPLSRQGVLQLAGIAQHHADDLFSITRGNPFFVTEVLAESAATHREGVPSTIRDAVLARMSRLQTPTRELLDLASVIPGRMEFWLANALMGPQAQSALDDALTRRILIPAEGGAGVMFRHELARRATEDTLGPAHGLHLHQQVLQALQKAPRPELARLVYHAAQCNDGEQVLQLAPRAAAQAAALGGHREAAAHYATALKFVQLAPTQLRAELYENWSYEAGLALHIDDAVIAARHEAIKLWRALGNIERVGLNLRWLARLHWYQGNRELADRYAEQAVQELEAIAPCAELAMCYSVRSQRYMLVDDTDNTLVWGQRALALADQLAQPEIRVHALNNMGTALLFAHRAQGKPMLEESLRLSLAHGYHEHAARVYTNMSEYAVVFKDFATAEHYLSEGIAFDTQHDLDSWTHYLVGWLAQLRLEQGLFGEAEEIAQGVLAIPRLTAVMRLPALTVLARLHVRRGDADGRALLTEALDLAWPTGEGQRIVPLSCALAEAEWLEQDNAAALEAVRKAKALPGVGRNPWEVGELDAWALRCGQSTDANDLQAPPYRAEIMGHAQDAAAQWAAIGAPYEQALALMQGGPAELASAINLFEQLGAKPAANLARSMARARAASKASRAGRMRRRAATRLA
ncbi:MAG: ATP-binding protein [Burkholderiaceae bacterium]